MEIVMLLAGLLGGTIVALVLMVLAVKVGNELDMKKRTGLSKAQRERNRAVAAKQWELVQGARLTRFSIHEDGWYSYTELVFDNGYTATVATIHGHTATYVKATETEEGTAL